jgi:hypothetical protein
MYVAVSILGSLCVARGETMFVLAGILILVKKAHACPVCLESGDRPSGH